MNTEQEEKLRELMRVFLEENKKLNLSAFRDEQSCWIGNILDSLAFLEVLPSQCHPERSRGATQGSCFDYAQHDTNHLSILDIGIGGGFPFLPLAISLPEGQFTGIDSTKKKIDAIERIVDALHLSNVQLIWGRAEEHKNQYDIVLARAVAPLKKLLPLAAPLTKPDGVMVFWKSMKIEEELKESEAVQKKLGVSLADTYVYELPGDWGKRQLLVFKK